MPVMMICFFFLFFSIFVVNSLV